VKKKLSHYDESGETDGENEGNYLEEKNQSAREGGSGKKRKQEAVFVAFVSTPDGY